MLAADRKPIASLRIGQVLAWRMQRQLVHPVGSLGIADTVRTMVGAQAQVLDVEGETCLALAADLDELCATGPARSVRLLAGFDQYVLGPGTGDTRIVAAYRRGDVSRAAGWISPVVIAGGRVVGVWKLEGELLEVSLFAEGRPVAAKALASEAERVGAAVGRELRLAVARR